MLPMAVKLAYPVSFAGRDLACSLVGLTLFDWSSGGGLTKNCPRSFQFGGWAMG